MVESSSISVCHVLNAVDETSTEAEWAVRQADDVSVSNVTVVAWFRADSFEGDDDVTVISLDVPSDRLVPSRETFQRLKAIVADHSIVHTHQNHSGVFAKLAAWQADTPAVVTEHNDHAGFTLKGRIGNGITNRFAEEIVCVSESVRRSFAQWERLLLHGKEVSVIRNGVDIERIDAARSLDWSVRQEVDLHPDAIVVGSAGMLTEQKGHEVLLEAVDRANEAVERPVELVISGRGPLRETLERRIAEARFPYRLHLLGFLEDRDHVYKMLHDIDVYAMPSRWEGFCVAALEAMTAENPCVFSDIPAFEVPFGNSARFHPVDDAEALADVLVDLVESRSERRDLAQRGRRLVVDNHSLQSTVDAYLNRYRTHADS